MTRGRLPLLLRLLLPAALLLGESQAYTAFETHPAAARAARALAAPLRLLHLLRRLRAATHSSTANAGGGVQQARLPSVTTRSARPLWGNKRQEIRQEDLVSVSQGRAPKESTRSEKQEVTWYVCMHRLLDVTSRSLCIHIPHSYRTTQTTDTETHTHSHTDAHGIRSQHKYLKSVHTHTAPHMQQTHRHTLHRL